MVYPHLSVERPNYLSRKVLDLRVVPNQIKLMDEFENNAASMNLASALINYSKATAQVN